MSTIDQDAKGSTTALPKLKGFMSKAVESNTKSKLSGFGTISKWAVKLKRKAAQVKKKSGKKSSTFPKASLIPSSKVYKPASPVKYTERPERVYRRVPLNHLDIPSKIDLDLARYEERPQATAFPEFDGKIQLPPVTLSRTISYKSPEERSLPLPFAEPAEDRLCTEGILYCQDMPNHLFYPVFGFIDIMVPVLFCFEDSKKESYLHVRDVRGHSSKIIGWREAKTGKNGHFKCFCFEIHSQLNLGTGNEALTFGAPDRNLAFKWLNYIRRSSQNYSDSSDLIPKIRSCPIPPPPTRRYRNNWASFIEVARTEILVHEDSDDISDKDRSISKERYRTIQQILLDVGLIMDEKWVGGPATVFTIEERATLQIQTWYRCKSAHYLVYGPHGLLASLWAAKVLQKSLRGWRIRRRLKRVKESAVIIQRHWRSFRLARNVIKAKKDMDRKMKRAKAYFVNSTIMRVIRIWQELVNTSLRAKDICRRALLGSIHHKFEKWCAYVDFRLQVKYEKEKQEKREKERRAMFFIKKMLYRHAATAIHSWKVLVEQNKRARSLLKRHLTGLVENHYFAWFEYVEKLKKSRLLCKRVLFGTKKYRFDDWVHFINGRTAARKIQTCWRRFTTFRNYILLGRWQQYTISCARIIQSCWRIHVAWQSTWGAGGVYVKMVSSRLIQTNWRGYSKRRDYQIYLRKINLLQERFRYWFYHRRSAAIFIQFQWRRYWNWKVRAVSASIKIQTQIRRYFVKIDCMYQKEEISSSFQWDGVVVRGVIKIPDRYGAMHRVLCTVKHESGTMRFVFVDPRTCVRSELYFRTMQLIELTEERWSVRRHMHDIVSLAQAVLDLIIVMSPGSHDTEYILRPIMLSAFAQKSKIAYPLRSPEMVNKNNILPIQVEFWESVYSTSAINLENHLPIGLASENLVLGTDKDEMLRDFMLSINDYCGNEDMEERLHIGGNIINFDLDTLLTSDKTQSQIKSDESTYNESDSDEAGTKITKSFRPTIVLEHSYTLAKLLVGLNRAPLDIFDRIEHSVAEILRERNKKATEAFGEFAQNRGMRPPTRETVDSSLLQHPFRSISGWNSSPVALHWEILIENSMSEMHATLDKTQQMETPFLNIRETYEEAVVEQEYIRDTSCYSIQQGADDLTNYLAHAGAVNSTTDMMIRARIAAFIDQCEDRIQLLNNCGHIQHLHEAIKAFRILEEMRIQQLNSAFEMEDKLYPVIEVLQEKKRNFAAAFFSKQRKEIYLAEKTLLETANHLKLILIPELDEVINRCVCAAEDFKSVMFEMAPALEEIKERAHMHREDIEAWYAHQSISIVGERDALNAEIAAKEKERIAADLAEAARGGKTIEQVQKERKERDAANRIARVYRAYLQRNNHVNTGGVWKELLYSSKILINCLDLLVLVMEASQEESYDLAMIQSLQMRVHKLSEQTVLRNLGPCLKHAHVIEKRWPIVLGLIERWEEEDRLAALKEDNNAVHSSSDEESSWDSDDFNSDDGSDEDSDDEDSDDEDSDDDSDSDGDVGGSNKEKAKEAVARSNLLPKDIHAKLRVLWRAHLSNVQKERERQAAIRAAQFGPRMRRKMINGAKYVGRSVANSGIVKFVGKKMNSVAYSVKQQLHSMKGYQKFKLAFALFGYNHFPQYFAIPEGVKEKKSILIQKIVRGMLARMLAARMIEERDEMAFDLMMNSAATKIQTLFRYFAARKFTLELVRTSYDKIYDDKAAKWCYHNTVADSYTYVKPSILGDALDLPTPRSKARGMKWSAGFYVEKSKKSAIVQRKLVLTNTVMHTCNHPACDLMEEIPNSFVQCPRCKVKYYCGRPHQLNHLDQHGDECEIIVNQNRLKRAQARAAKKLGVEVDDLNFKVDNRTEEERKKDKMAELFKLEKLIDQLKKGLIDQETYTNELRKLTDL